MERTPDSSLIIGVATSTAERVQLARLLSGADALLIVSNPDQARAFLDLTTPAGSTPVVLTSRVLPDLDPTCPASDGPSAEQQAASTAEELAALSVSAAVRVVAAAPDDDAGAVDLPAGLRLDRHRRVLRWKDREMPLTRLELDFLSCLVKQPGQVWTYQRLHLAVWGNEHLGHGSHIHSVVKRLRQKLARLGAAVTIHAVRGVGFHLLPAT